MKSVFMTGATGAVGVELVRILARRASPPRLSLLMRGDDAERAAKARWLRAWCGAGEIELDVLPGDVRLSGLGLSSADRARLADVDTVIHGAADTAFAQSRADAIATNVAGTRHALELADDLPRLSRFAHISTAFSCGSRTGRILEDEIPDPAAGFDNEYERSKAEAEVLVRRASLPYAIFRPSIVVGRVEDGAIAHMRDAVYFVIKRIHDGMLPMFPGGERAVVDLVPVDFVARAMVFLVGDRFSAGATYHVCAGSQRSIGIDEFMRLAWCALADAEPAWGRRGYPRPVSVDTDTFRDFLSAIELIGNRRLQQVAAHVDVVRKPLSQAKAFDTSRLDRDLAGSGIELPHARGWFGAVVRRALRERFRPLSWQEMRHAG